AWPAGMHAVVAIADKSKGERLVLVTNQEGAEVRQLLGAARAEGIPEIMVPRTILPVAVLPRLGTGKVDYPAVQRLAEAELAPRVAAAASLRTPRPAQRGGYRDNRNW